MFIFLSTDDDDDDDDDDAGSERHNAHVPGPRDPEAGECGVDTAFAYGFRH